MSRGGGMPVVEQDLTLLYRHKDAVLARLDALGTIQDPIERKEATLRFCLDHPGIGSVGDLLKRSEHERLGIVAGLLLDDDHYQFVTRLLRRIDQDPVLYATLRQVLPLSFPPPPPAKPPEFRRVSRSDSAPEQTNQEPAPSPQEDQRKPLPPLLSKLLIGLHTGTVVPSLTFADTVRGSFAGMPEQVDLRLQLMLQPEGDIEVVGVNQDAPKRTDRGDGLIVPIRHQAGFTLIDGSEIYAEQSAITRNSRSFDVSGWKSEWRGLLCDWYWWRSEEVRYWVGLGEASLSGPSLNFDLQDSVGMGIGLHVPGSPSITVVARPRSDAGAHEHPAAVVIEAVTSSHEARSRLFDLSTILQSAMVFPIPHIFYGYDDNAEICAAISVNHGAAKLYDITDAINGSTFIPNCYGDTFKLGGRVWMSPLLQRLRASFYRRVSPIRDSVAALRWVLEEKVWDFQITKLGMAIRILMHSDGALRGDDYLDPARVWLSLRAYAFNHGILLPEGTKDALDLSHRTALLGPRGVAPRRIEAELDFKSGMQALATLRVAYASLIAGMIGYTGPIFKRLAPDRSSSLVHYPLKNPDPAEVAADEAAAQERFVARVDATS